MSLSSEASSLNHLAPLSAPLTPSLHRNITQAFLNSGWKEVITNHIFKHYNRTDMPILVLPGDELSAQRIDSIPITYSSGLTLGEFLLKTAWIRNLSPRLIYFYPNGANGPTETILKFIEKPAFIPFSVSRPPNLLSVDRTLLSEESDPIILNKTEGQGVLLSKLIGEITIDQENSPPAPFKHFHDSILIPRGLRNIHVRLHLETKSFSEILDAITYYLNATWEWVNESKICIVPHPSSKIPVHAWINYQDNDVREHR